MYKEFSKVYDEFMEYADYDGWYDFIWQIIENSEIKGNKFLDLGCGTGEVLIRANEDFVCDGIDLSEGMLEAAKEKLDNLKMAIPLVKKDMRELDGKKRYDVIVSLFDTVNHLTSNEDLGKLFDGIYNSLEDDGIYIFDVVDREFMDEMFYGGVFLDERENMTVIWEHEEEEGLDYIKTTFFVKTSNGSYTRYSEEYCKKIFESNEIEKMLTKSNLVIRGIYENTELAGDRNFYVIERRK